MATTDLVAQEKGTEAMNKPIEFYNQIDSRWSNGSGGRVVQCFKNDELSEWCVNGTWFDNPFWVGPKGSKKWVVSHVGTMRSISSYAGHFTFKKALSLAAHLDAITCGMSQVREQERDIIDQDVPPLGWDRTQSNAVKSAIDSWLQPANTNSPDAPTEREAN